jgi:hypothetical protein
MGELASEIEEAVSSALNWIFISQLLFQLYWFQMWLLLFFLSRFCNEGNAEAS